jgi:hypothetical protein
MQTIQNKSLKLSFQTSFKEFKYGIMKTLGE